MFGGLAPLVSVTENGDAIVDRHRPLDAQLPAEHRVDDRRLSGVELSDHDDGEQLLEAGQKLLDPPPLLALLALEQLPQRHQQLPLLSQQPLDLGVDHGLEQARHAGQG